MNKRLKSYIIVVLLTLTISAIFIMPALCNVDPTISVYIKGNYKKNLTYRSFNLNLNVHRTKDTIYDQLKQKYNLLLDSFNKDYKYNEKLIDESSTIQQVYQHSKNQLYNCVKYVLKQSNLKDEILLLYLVGPWNGYSNITINEKTGNAIYKINRDLSVSFESNQAGQISKGFLQGTEKITKNTQNTIQKSINKNNITGSVTGNIVPNASFNLLLKFDNNYPNDNFLKKYNSLELKGKNYVNFTPIVTSNILDNAFNVYVSNMKIYYNLLFKNEKDPRLLIQNRYNLFFNDILTLLYYTNKEYISKGLVKSQKIYNKSEFVSSAFEKYVGSLNNFYNKKIENSFSTRIKISLYRNLLEELIQACSFCHLSVFENTIADRLDLNLDKPNNLIDRTFFRYYTLGNKYYLKKLSSNLSKEDKNFYKKHYLTFMGEIIEIKNTGLISKLILNELNINDNALKNIENLK